PCMAFPAQAAVFLVGRILRLGIGGLAEAALARAVRHIGALVSGFLPHTRVVLHAKRVGAIAGIARHAVRTGHRHALGAVSRLALARRGGMRSYLGCVVERRHPDTLLTVTDALHEVRAAIPVRAELLGSLPIERGGVGGLPRRTRDFGAIDVAR